MKLAGLATSVLMLLLSVAATAQTTATFTDDDGTFTYNVGTGQLDIGMTNGNFTGASGGAPADGLGSCTAGNPCGTASQLTAISGLGPYGISDNSVPFSPFTPPAGSHGVPSVTCTPACLGTVTLATGTLISSSISATTGLGSSTYGAGGTFTVQYANGVVFTSTFTSATFTQVGSGAGVFWVFTGQLANGTLTIPQSSGPPLVITNVPGGTVQLTTVGGMPIVSTNKGSIEYKNNSGQTNLPIAPEPGTLMLFGSGLIAVGAITRRKLTGRATESVKK